MEITGKMLLAWGFETGPALGIALDLIKGHFAGFPTESVEASLKKVLATPDQFVEDPILGALATALLPPPSPFEHTLREDKLPYQSYGAENIEKGAITQMETALRLPVAVGGALMADAHYGYGLPIGGVLATKNAVIPYGVGMDIGCRMCMSLFSLPSQKLEEEPDTFKKMLLNNTQFGKSVFKKPKDHAVLESKLFADIPFLRPLKDKAYKQIGTSGGGNHFVEFGTTEIVEEENEWGLAKGLYLTLLSHSGSRGFGGAIAQRYTKVAMEACPLPKPAQHLAWLNLDSEAGQEYWLAMNLAGDYASACHHQIHERVAESLGEQPLAMVENHHNFAWKEQDAEGNEVIVHRKGATPAGKGVLGIIPGSMATPGFLVRGKGVMAAFNSASHGAGRAMSRTAAKNKIDSKEVANMLKNNGVELIGSGLDEAPMAYKDIHQVMAAQSELVETVGIFRPKIVRMCGDQQFKEVD